MKKINPKKIVFDRETLKRWKYSSTRAKIDFLDAALKFAKAKRSD